MMIDVMFTWEFISLQHGCENSERSLPYLIAGDLGLKGERMSLWAPINTGMVGHVIIARHSHVTHCSQAINAGIHMVI